MKTPNLLSRARAFPAYCLALGLLFTLACSVSTVVAQTVATYNQDANGSWILNTNWNYTTGNTYPNGVGDVANLTNSITGIRNVSLNTGITLGTLNIGGNNAHPNAFQILTGSGTNVLTFDVASGNATLNKSGSTRDGIFTAVTLNDRLVVSNGNATGIIAFEGSTVSGTGGFTNNGLPLTSAIGTNNSFLEGVTRFNTVADFSGSTELNSGILVINSGGTTTGSSTAALTNTSSINFNGGSLVVYNSGLALNNNRINNAANFNVTAGGAFYYGHTSTANTTFAESVGTLNLQGGSFDYKAREASSATVTSTVTFADLVRSGTATANFGSGSTTSAVTLGGITNQVRFTNIGGVAAGNSTFMGAWATYGNYGSFAAYNTSNGVHMAATTALAAGSDGAAVNFQATSNTTLTVGDKSYNTLGFNDNFNGLLTVDLNDNTLTLASGGIAMGANRNTATRAITNGTIIVGTTPGPDTLYIHAGTYETNVNTISAVLADNLSDTLTVVKAGPGLVILNGNMTYTGATILEGGTLQIGSDGSLANGAVMVNRATNFTMLSGAEITFNLTSAVVFDQFTQEAGGAFTLDGTMNVNFASALQGSWDVFNTQTAATGFDVISITGAYSGNLTNSLGVWSGNISGYDFSFSEATGILTVVPEPSALALVGLGLSALLFRRTSRRRNQ